MKNYRKLDSNEYRLKKYIETNNIVCEHLIFEKSCHSVQEAASAVNANIDEFVKNICMIDENENIIVVIVKGEDRASTSRVQKALSIPRPKIANPDEIFEKTTYPCGGVPSFGFNAKFLIDPKVIEKNFIYTSGGSENSLIKISTKELLKANKGEVLRIRK